MKITDLQPRTAKFTLLHPLTDKPATTDDGLPVVIEVIGVDSQEFFKHQQNIHRRMRDLHLAAGTTINAELSDEQMDQLMIESLSVCVLGWDAKLNPFFATIDTKKGGGKFSKKLVEKILADERMFWFRTQLEVYINTRSNFFVT